MRLRPLILSCLAVLALSACADKHEFMAGFPPQCAEGEMRCEVCLSTAERGLWRQVEKCQRGYWEKAGPCNNEPDNCSLPEGKFFD